MTERWRLFVGVTLPGDVRDVIARIPSAGVAGDAIRWERPELLHVTLHFLGPSDPAVVPRIVGALDHGVSTLRTCSLTLAAPGAFPTPERARVIWVGLGGEIDALRHLQAAVVDSLAPLGFAAEARGYHPHITIGRVRRDASPATRRNVARDLAALIVPHGVGFSVGTVTLFRSVQSAGVLRYPELDRVPLQTR